MTIGAATGTPRRYYRGSAGPCTAPRTRSGRSWRPPAPSNATIPVWSGQTRWLTALAAALDTAEGQAARTVYGSSVKVQTIMDIAATDAVTADARTGRHVATAHQTVADELRCSTKTVQRAREVIERLGYAKTLTEGRYLSSAERAAAREHHSKHQRRIASERVLTQPRRSPPTADAAGGAGIVKVHLPRRGHLSPTPLVTNRLPSRASARPGAVSRAKTAPKKAARPPLPPSRPPLAVQRLAAGLAERLPWLVRHCHIGRLCTVLQRLGLSATDWTTTDVLNLLERRHKDRGLYALPPSAQSNPLGLFTVQLRDALASGHEAPGIARRREARARAEARARLDAERRKEKKRAAAAATPAALDRRRALLTQTRVQIRTAQTTHKRRTALSRHSPTSSQ